MEIRLVAPLQWPTDVPRAKERRNGDFQNGSKLATDPRAAIERLEKELAFWNAEEPELAADFGRTSGGRVSLAVDKFGPDPGVLLRFDAVIDGKGQTYVLPSDTFTTKTQNILALVNHLDATRRIVRYGIGTTAQMMGAFASLPASTTPVRSWREIFIVTGSDRRALAQAEEAYRKLSREAHPDLNGGDGSLQTELNLAIEAARAELGG